MVTLFKYLFVLIVSGLLVLSVLLLLSDTEIDSAYNDTQMNEFYDKNESNKEINVFDDLNYIPDAAEMKRIKSLAGLNVFFWVILFLSPAVYTIIIFLFKRCYSSIEIISFGVYSAVTNVFLYNILLFANFQSWNWKYAFEILITGTGIGLASALYSISVCVMIELLSLLKEEGISFYELIISKYYSPNIALSLSFAGSWFMFAVLISGLVLIKIIL